MTTRPKPDSWTASPARVFRRKTGERDPAYELEQRPMQREQENGRNNSGLPRYNHNGHKVAKGIEPEGESGRRWVNPWKMLLICGRSSSRISMLTNILWPFVIAAMVLHFGFPEKELWIFVTAYIGMVPSANLVGFAGQELARKLPTVLGVVLETTFGSVVEIVLFMVLIKQPGTKNIPVIRAAILGSILANMLLCLGLCFFIGGIFHPQQSFHEAISEVGSNLMLVAGFGLVVPTIFFNALSGRSEPGNFEMEALKISRAAAIVLLIAFVFYVWFQVHSHHNLYEEVLKQDEHQDRDRQKDLAKDKLTLTEACIAVLIGITFVTFMAIFLVQKIDVCISSCYPDTCNPDNVKSSIPTIHPFIQCQHV